MIQTSSLIWWLIFSFAPIQHSLVISIRIKRDLSAILFAVVWTAKYPQHYFPCRWFLFHIFISFVCSRFLRKTNLQYISGKDRFCRLYWPKFSADKRLNLWNRHFWWVFVPSNFFKTMKNWRSVEKVFYLTAANITFSVVKVAWAIKAVLFLYHFIIIRFHCL